MKKILGPVLLVVLLVGVGAAIAVAVSSGLKESRIVSVRGLIGSEKEAFFKDPDVIEALRKGGLEVQVEKAGSRQIATHYDLSQYDFAFPAGVPAAEKLRRDQGDGRSYDVFFTPMAIAAWHPIARALEAEGLAADQGGYYTLDMGGLLALIEAGTRWADLASNAEYAVDKSILISSTDVRTSNSAAMYLSLASFVANGNRVVQSDEDVAQVMPLMQSLFLQQGFQEGSSQGPFDNYLVMGMGKAPLVMIYEAQFLAAAANGTTTPEMVLMYPEPTIFSKHVLVAWTEGGKRLGKLLRNDPELQTQDKAGIQEAAAELQRLAVRHGFRNSDLAAFQAFVSENSLALPDNFVNVIDPPSYDLLERAIQRIEAQY